MERCWGWVNDLEDLFQPIYSLILQMPQPLSQISAEKGVFNRLLPCWRSQSLVWSPSTRWLHQEKRGGAGHPLGGQGRHGAPAVPGRRIQLPQPRAHGRALAGPPCQGSARGGDVFADINHRGEQCGRGGGGSENGLCAAPSRRLNIYLSRLCLPVMDRGFQGGARLLFKRRAGPPTTPVPGDRGTSTAPRQQRRKEALKGSELVRNKPGLISGR